MSRSHLTYKLSLCEAIRHLNRESCIAVIQSFHHEFGCKNLNELLIKMILQWADNTTAQSFKAMQNIINFMIVDNHKKLTSSHNNSKLLQLPIDLISKTSLYLNENDIFNFEKCCRVFYQTISKSLYVNQSNNFKTLIIKPDKLSQTTNCKHSCSFYKYSKPTTLVIKQFHKSISATQAQKQWEKVRDLAAFNDEWYSSMIKSIQTLKITNYEDGATLFDQLLIDAIFAQDEAALAKLIIVEKSRTANNAYDFNRNWKQFRNTAIATFKRKHQSLA